VNTPHVSTQVSDPLIKACDKSDACPRIFLHQDDGNCRNDDGVDLVGRAAVVSLSSWNRFGIRLFIAAPKYFQKKKKSPTVTEGRKIVASCSFPYKNQGDRPVNFLLCRPLGF
jgi:hypothetical protein